MSLLDRLERTRFGKFGIPNLMRYVIGVNIVGILISLVNPTFYYSYLSLDIASILHGQVWRIFTFVLSHPDSLAVPAWLVYCGLQSGFLCIIRLEQIWSACGELSALICFILGDFYWL